MNSNFLEKQIKDIEEEGLYDLASEPSNNKYKTGLKPIHEKGNIKENSFYFLKKTAGIKLLSKEEELEIGKKLVENKQKIFKALITNNKTTLYYVCEELRDTIQREKFDEEKGRISYMPPDESKAFQKAFTQLEKNKDYINLTRLLREADFSSQFYDKMIKYSIEKLPRLKQRKDLASIISLVEADKEKLINHNLRSIRQVYFMKGYWRIPNVEADDLMQEGYLGLRNAADKYDYRVGGKFMTMAVWWVDQAMRREISNNSRTIRLPVHIGQQISSYFRTKVELAKKLSRVPTEKELAEQMNLSIEQVKNITEAAKEPISTSVQLGEDYTIEDILSKDDKKNVSMEENKATIEMAFEKVIRALKDSESVPEREYKVLEQRYLKGKTLQEVGDYLKLSRERVRQIEAKSLRKARLVLLKKGFTISKY
ncbi:sigma-70 family RNA polymerase sigma factor [Candidatus Woesearchaeota archaeon]|nr:sigma-70 family RNA polymerase sigma factor [Candidatus Woesearchaeota archaeon]